MKRDLYFKCAIKMEQKGGVNVDRYTPEQARKLAGYSQKEMAEKLNISENAYIQKEKGIVRFYVDEACKFCDVVNIPLSKIIFLSSMCRKSGTQ